MTPPTFNDMLGWLCTISAAIIVTAVALKIGWEILKARLE